MVISKIPGLNYLTPLTLLVARSAIFLLLLRSHISYQRMSFSGIKKNYMGRYGTTIVGDINDSVNIGPPKAEETTTAHSPQYVTHIPQRQAAELWPIHHNITVQYLDSAARPYLFAHFAWAILLQVKPFVTASFSRHVIRISTNGEGKAEYKLEHLSGLQLQDYYGGRESQGATPKRKSNTDTVGDEDDFMGPSGEDSDVNMDNGWEDTMDERQQRGKERRKQTSNETMVEEDNRAQVLSQLKTRFEEALGGGRDDIPQQR
ncbi:uncharacterized protein Z519_06393 [Cladophialophora bantiana CBS 173.52]|uniref:Uncharacterized protein n=1 Tax=Cladophialophora bantiana (strain ATCC 10958 / CBS 173.52 / CDC B-1940 / NIH 8579) TaxID=1442370 RepID=A0A0D2ERP7_CLAB1|nr:uncharacterized protein Z519_06393 [Cladophialophora bantiana CBS 173.52]KIW92546.1 hypothetical protein Z519_06393 [Cladophialophora bantiana CBS 173.52]